MFDVTLFNTVAYSVSFCALYYVGLCWYVKSFIRIEFVPLALYVTIFCLFGVVGEIVVNNIWELVFGAPLWTYHLYPAHGGDISYFFFFVWGGLGYYRYLNDIVFHQNATRAYVRSGIIMGIEAVFLELAYNGLFWLLFGSYIFYYLPENLGPLSHLSCVEVIPFYFLVGLLTSVLIAYHKHVTSSRYTIAVLLFYWAVIATLVFL